MSDNKIDINFNGKIIKAEKDQTILEVARQQGVDIPTLCYDDRMKPFASCFICVVEVKGARTLVPACSTKVAPNMEVQTNSEKVMSTRKMCLDLMLSNHSGDCLAPCKVHCPAATDVQGYVAHIANGDFVSAIKLIKSRLALPLVCGTICPNPCENECRRGLVDEPIAIRALKRFASEYDIQAGPFLPECKKESGKKVAIVGGGPAGLSAAFYLRQHGHAVDLYEALPQLGGMVRYGIPKFRLPWNKLDSEIKSIIDLGVKVHTNKRLGTDFSIADLQKKGADAVLIAIGAQVSKPMGIENEQVDGILGGVEFLRKVVLGEKIKHGRKVAVVGGGDVAMDCARVAKRLAPNMDVHLLYRRTQQEMPALKHEQEECHEEGVHFQFLTAPKAVVVGSDGRARALKVAQMRLGAPDASGRRRPEEVPGSEKDLDFDLIISAIGQDPEVACLEKDPIKLETTKWKTVVYDNKNMTTKVPGIFTAGDCSFGPNTVVQACAEGKIAADAISLYLNGADIKFREEYRISKGRIKELEREDFAPRFEQKKRQKEIIYKADKRLANGGYAPINESLTQIQSMAEASRCIECGCSARFNCSLRDYSTEYGACETIMPGKKNQPEIDKRHPLIRFEGEKCINCGSCVRVCNEVRQISALSFVDRGFKTHIAPNFERPLQATDCDACGMCIDVCPTGTIVMNHSKYEGVWEGPKAITTCTACGRGCALQVSSVDEKKIIKASSVANDKVNGGVICKEGRFSYALLKYKLNKENSNKSISHAKKLITKMKKPAIFVSPWLALEDLAAAGKLAQKLKGTLFYLTDPKRKGKEKHLFAKLPGVTNVAFLEKIGAKPANTKTNFNKADGAIILGAYLSKKLPRSIPVVAISNFAIGTKAHSYLHHLDQLERNGSFLNVDGVVRPLASDIKSSQPTIAELLAKLSGIDATSGISKEVSKLKVKKAIVAPDAREMAFAKYLHKMGL